MASWRKRLRAMADDPHPTEYSYEDVTSILKALGFKSFGSGGSHRTWKLVRNGSPTVRVPMVQSGSGKVLRWYIMDMIAALRAAQLIPEDKGG